MWAKVAAVGALLAVYHRDSLLISSSLFLGQDARLSKYMSAARLPNERIPPLPMLDLSTTGTFTQEELDKYLHIVKMTHAPVIIRGVLSKEELASLDDGFLLRACNNTKGKYIDNNLLESNRNIDLKNALRISDRGGLFQALNCCNLDVPRKLHMPTHDSYWERDNATALVVARLFHTKMHAHPDITVHFALRNSKKWVILHEDSVKSIDPKFGRTVPMGTDLFINQTQTLKRWEFDTHPGDVMLIPPWGFHGLEYYNSSTTISFLLSIYNHDVMLNHPLMHGSYGVHMLFTHWKLIFSTVLESVSEPLLIHDRVHAAITTEIYGKH